MNSFFTSPIFFVFIFRCKSGRQAAALEEEIRNKYGAKTEITFIKGGQPVYYYIISVE